MRVLLPLPHAGYDPTEAAVSWEILESAGNEIVFATPDGAPAAADPLMVTGDDLDPWGFIPILRKLHVVGAILAARRNARSAYERMLRDPAYARPLRYDELHAQDFGALVLPGGHAKEMRPFLESAPLQHVVADFFDEGKPVGAICHGVVLAARSVSPRTGNSVLHGRKTTALTWRLERQAAATGRIARFWDPTYYRTYPERRGEPPGYRSVQAEVTRGLARVGDFCEPNPRDPDYRRQTSGLHRDSATDSRPAFVVQDGNYVSARWPGDAYTFAKTLAACIAAQPAPSEKSGESW